MKMTVGEAVIAPVTGGHPLTDEQEAIVRAAVAGRSFKVEALAGTGKTSTLVAVAEAAPDRHMLYVAFNKSVQEEATRRMPANVQARTAHSLAFGSVGKDYAAASRLQRSVWALKLGLMRLLGPILEQAKKREHAYVFAVLDTLSAFIKSADDNLGPEHVEDRWTGNDAALILDAAQACWAAMADRTGWAPITDDAYLKLWQLSRPTLRRDLILFDECQDASPPMLAVVMRQSCQRIYVGDEHQQIYAWRGAKNALRMLELEVLTLTQSWRFGSVIAAHANSILAAKGATLRVKGAAHQDEVTVSTERTPDVVLARTNAGLVGQALALAEGGRSIAVVGGVEPLVKQIEATYELWRRGKSRHPAYVYFEGWAELEEAANTNEGQGYRPFVNLVKSYRASVPDVCYRLREAERPEGEADVLLCTIHRFKGREGRHVRLGDDLMPFVEKERDGTVRLVEEEANLGYVAVTRARECLELGPFAAVLAESLALADFLVHEAPSTLPAVAPVEPTLPLEVAAPSEAPAESAAPSESPTDPAADPAAALRSRIEAGQASLEALAATLRRLEAEDLDGTADYWTARRKYDRGQERLGAWVEALAAMEPAAGTPAASAPDPYVAALLARLHKGMAWLDGKARELDVLIRAHQTGTPEYQEGYAAYARQAARWLDMYEDYARSAKARDAVAWPRILAPDLPAAETPGALVERALAAGVAWQTVGGWYVSNPDAVAAAEGGAASPCE